MDNFFHVLAFITLYILLFGLASRVFKEYLFFGEPLISMLWGILVGPHVLNLLDPSNAKSKIVLFYSAKTVLCIQTMTCAMSLPHRYLLRRYKQLFTVVFLIGFTKYLLTFCLVYLLTPYNSLVSFGIAACVTPTDPILSNSIIKSKFADENVPERLRNLLVAESGINDGFGLFLLFLPFKLSFNKNVWNGIMDIIFNMILYKCVVSAIIGIILGYVARKVLYHCYANDMVGTETFLVYGLALAIFTLGFAEIFKMSELVCVFFTGTAFSWDEWFVFETRESKLQEVTDSIFTSTFFVFFGSRIDFSRCTINTVILGLLIIFFRRPFACLVFRRGLRDVRDNGEALFVGWFGPIGVGALYYSLYLDRMMKTVTFDVVCIVVFLSVLMHGLTIPMVKLFNGGRKLSFLSNSD